MLTPYNITNTKAHFEHVNMSGEVTVDATDTTLTITDMIKILQKLPNNARIVSVDYHVGETDTSLASLKIKYTQLFKEDDSALNTIPVPRGLNDSTDGVVLCGNLPTTPNTAYERKL